MARLPHTAGSIVGRSEDIRGIRDALDRARLVNLVGPGGVGKTALAAEVVDELEPEFDRSVLVELAEATREADVLRLLSNEALDQGGGDVDRLAAALNATPTLLVLDNCEHLVDEIAAMVSRLLASGGDLKILATSRRPLDLSTEVAWPVAPLAVPVLDRSDRDLVSTGSVQLFLERVRQSVPSFELTDANRAIVAEICTAADGVPLVLELAAALVRGRPLDQILEAMTHRPAGLVATRRDRANHQQSLAASLDWSRRFLVEADADLLDRLSVFVGGFTAASARHLDQDDTVDGLSRLVDHSLITFDQATERYRMLEVVRLDAFDRLTDEHRHDVEGRHLVACQEIAAALADTAYEADPDNRFPRFELELPNLCAALRRTYNRGEMDSFRSLLGPIAVWLVHYVAPERPATWEEAFAAPGVPTVWRANIEAAIAFYWSHRGRPDLALVHATNSADLSHEIGDGTRVAMAYNAAANAHLVLGDREAAAAAYRLALAEARNAGSVYGELVVRVSAARLDPVGSEALDHLTAARKLAGAGFSAIECSVLTGLGLHALHNATDASDIVEARRLCDEGLDRARRLAYSEIVAEALCGRAAVAGTEGDREQARALYEEALNIGLRRVHQGVIDRASDGLGALSASATAADEEATAGPGQRPDATGANGDGAARAGRGIDGGEVVELSDRELSVARLLRGDLTQREIADELYIAPSTVKSHIKSIYRKLGVAKRSYAVTRAAELGLFD